MEQKPLKELDIVALTQEFPLDGAMLTPSLAGVVVLVHNDGEAYEVEFVNDQGDTIAITTIPAAALRHRVGPSVGGEEE